MSRFDVCKCGNSEKALEEAEKIVRSLFLPNGDLCLVWAATISSCVDAILQETTNRMHGTRAQTDVVASAWANTEALRPHIEVIAASIIADTSKSAPNAG